MGRSLNIFRAPDDVIGERRIPKDRGKSRTVYSFGLRDRAIHTMLDDIAARVGPSDPRQFEYRGGVPAAIDEIVKQAAIPDMKWIFEADN